MGIRSTAGPIVSDRAAEIVEAIQLLHDLGKNDEVRSIRLCFFDRRNDLPYIARDIAVGRIYLTDRNFHLI